MNSLKAATNSKMDGAHNDSFYDSDQDEQMASASTQSLFNPCSPYTPVRPKQHNQSQFLTLSGRRLNSTVCTSATQSVKEQLEPQLDLSALSPTTFIKASCYYEEAKKNFSNELLQLSQQQAFAVDVVVAASDSESGGQTEAAASSAVGTVAAAQMPSSSSSCWVPSSSSSVVASHYNALPEMGIQRRNDSRILHLRNFNNWMKSMLIAEFLERLKEDGCCAGGGATVLDLCCGKGGDLRKWRVGGIREIVMTDIADVSLNDARERFHRMRDRRTGRPPFRTHFLPADLCEVSLNDRLSADAPAEFDLCSCQFSLHYAFRSEQCAHQMLRNATDRLKPGGYFIGTVPDASAIMHYLRRSNGRFANEVCTVSIEGDANAQPALFGAQIRFRLEGVVDCPEYLCYFPLLKQMLDEMGLELVYSQSFPDAIDYFMERRGREARNLMESMNALETVECVRRLTAEKGGPESAQREYGTALARLQAALGDDNNSANNGHGWRQRRGLHQQQRTEAVGTLSASEWQVLTMYRVFAFQRRQRC